MSKDQVEIGEGVVFHGDFEIGRSIRDSFERSSAATSDGTLQALLLDLAKTAVGTCEQMPLEDARDFTHDLSTLVGEAVKESPRPAWLALSASALMEAAAGLGKAGQRAGALVAQIARYPRGPRHPKSTPSTTSNPEAPAAKADPAMAETIFTKILSGEIPSHRVYEDEHVFAFLDINPLSPGHTLVIPKEAVATLDRLSDESSAAIGRVLPRIARAVLRVTGARDFNVVQNNGRSAHQFVDHVHFHIIPKMPDGRGLGVGWDAGELGEEGEALARAMAEAIEGDGRAGPSSIRGNPV